MYTAAIKAGIAIVGAVTSAYMTYQSTKAQYAAAEAQQRAIAEAAEYDARLKSQAAEVARRNERMATERLLAEQRALYGASGVQVGVGSPLLVELETAALGEYKAQLSGYAEEIGASQSRYSALLAQTEASNLHRQGPYQALVQGGGSLLKQGGTIFQSGKTIWDAVGAGGKGGVPTGSPSQTGKGP